MQKKDEMKRLKSEFPEFYMGWHRNRDILLKSSSGGAFSALADIVFDRGGVIFGAAKRAGEVPVFHKAAENLSELEEIRLSKYSQSDLGDTFKQVKAYLEKGRLVLFTGTACQVDGLKSYLRSTKTNRDKLITMDVLCHGVPGSRVIRSYLESQSKFLKKEISDFAFRVKTKERGWYRGGGTRMHLLLKDGTEFVAEGPYDTFFLGFNNNFFLRESCYKCCYCGLKKPSDLTFADFWRCSDKRIPPEQMMLGVSLILVNSEKGRELLGEMKRDMTIYEIEPESAVPYNKALREPQERPEIRDTFFKQMDKYGFNGVIERTFRRKFLKYRAKLLLKRILPRRIAVKIMKNI